MTFNELIWLRYNAIKKEWNRRFLDWQIKDMDKAIYQVERTIRNEQEVLRILHRDRMLANNRRNGLR